jgi:hypothetical protein
VYQVRVELLYIVMLSFGIHLMHVYLVLSDFIVFIYIVLDVRMIKE